MGHHINSEGRFQSDKYPDLAPDKIVLSFKDPAAIIALRVFAGLTEDKELGEDIAARLQTIQPQPPRGFAIQGNEQHDAGAYGRCSYCNRYTDDHRVVTVRYCITCDCGKAGGWSCSFAEPDEKSEWSNHNQ